VNVSLPRRALIALAIGAGSLSAALYFTATQRADVVVMARDVDEPRPLTSGDIEIRTIAAELAPPDALRSIADVIGLTPRAPMLRGQLVLERAVAAELVELRGWPLDATFRAVALPVRAVDAVGGVLVPGSRVDVLAMPIAGRGPADRTAEVLVTDAAVLDVRTESGASYATRDPKSGAIVDRLAAVVIAIRAVDEARIADRLATSTFAFALVGDR
jgi:Flp pilus assembly protein CpaB